MSDPGQGTTHGGWRERQACGRTGHAALQQQGVESRQQPYIHMRCRQSGHLLGPVVVSWTADVGFSQCLS